MENEITHGLIHLTYLPKTGKYEILISKLETNSNDRNINDQNTNLQYQNFLNLELLDFDIVSDFGFRYSDFVMVVTSR